jgi:hypothetical protein
MTADDAAHARIEETLKAIDAKLTQVHIAIFDSQYGLLPKMSAQDARIEENTRARRAAFGAMVAAIIAAVFAVFR